jgi:chromosomal replication initiator protein
MPGATVSNSPAGGRGRTRILASGVVSLPLAGRVPAHEVCPEADESRGGGLREFVAGAENRLAVIAVEQVLARAAEPHQPDSPARPAVEAEDGRLQGFAIAPHGGLSPLVLHGMPGTGKSHLARGLVAEWRRCWPTRQVLCATAAEFAQQYAEAVERRLVGRWRAVYRAADLLVLEDIGYLAIKAPAQIELLHTFDALADRGAMVAVTARVAPRTLPGLMPGLRSRLGSGLTVHVVPPEVEARRTIVGRLAEARGLKLTDTVVRLLADSLAVTAPELAGALASLELELAPGKQSARPGETLRVSGRPKLDETLVRNWLKGRTERRPPSLQGIAARTARYFALRVADLKSASRRRGVVVARDVAMYLARQLTGKSLKQIGDFFGGRDHTTVLHGCRKTERLMRSDPETLNAVVELRQGLATG